MCQMVVSCDARRLQPARAAATLARMLTARALLSGPVSVVEYACSAGPEDRPFAELHEAWSVSYVQRGSFGCRCGGLHHELVPGSVLVGRPGDEYTCTHEHHLGGDVYLAVFVQPDLLDEMARGKRWQSGVLPPLPALMVQGELARAAAGGDTDIGVDEAGLALVSRFLGVAGPAAPKPLRLRPQDRRRAVESALWIEANAHDEALDLAALAAQAGLSPYHYLRLFSAALGVTPHQYLLRCRLRQAARLLADEPEQPITEVALAAGFADASTRSCSSPWATRWNPAARGMRVSARPVRRRCGSMRTRATPAPASTWPSRRPATRR
jgi:AraC family transcriptional regulator